MENLQAQTQFNFGVADAGSCDYPDRSLSIDIEASRDPRATKNQNTYLNSNDLDVLQNLLNSPTSIGDIKPTVKPTETWNGGVDDFLLESRISSCANDPSPTYQTRIKENMPNHKEQWGQITPCTDDSSDLQSPNCSDFPLPKEHDGMADFTSASNTLAKRTPKNPQGLKSSQTNSTSRARKNSSSSSGARTGKSIQDESGLQDDEVKRERFLKRNRVAASKCRQKKKEYINGLEERARELTSTRNHLMAYVASLKDEIIALKTEMLKHSNCNCVAIQEYLRREASLLSEIAEVKGYEDWCKGPETSLEGT